MARLGDLVARYSGVTLYRDRLEWGRRVKPLDGVRARVVEASSEFGAVHDVHLVVTGPDWEWNIPIVAVLHTRKARGFAALINSYADPGAPSGDELVGSVG